MIIDFKFRKALLECSLKSFYDYINFETKLEILYCISDYILKNTDNRRYFNYKEQEFLEKKYLLVRIKIDHITQFKSIRNIFQE